MTTKRRRSKSEMGHAEWLRLLDVSGPFLSLPVLNRVFPQGLDREEDEPEVATKLKTEHREWLGAPMSGEAAASRRWVDFVLGDVLRLPGDRLVRDPREPWMVRVDEHRETLCPDVVLVDPAADASPSSARLSIQVVPRGQSLEKPLPDRLWKASPATRMAELLRATGQTGVPLGLLTNGDRWMLVHAPRGETESFVSWFADLWQEERLTLRAFRALLGRARFFGVPDDETLPAMLKASESDQQELTDQLGLQVRRSVEILVDSIDRADRERHGALLEGWTEREVYEAAVTVMMRLVFLLYAEEQELLPADEELWAENYAASTLLPQLDEAADHYGPEILEHGRMAWPRLLATFRAIHGGVDHEALRLEAYGGSLFDPDRFPFLEGRARGTKWREEPATPMGIDDRTVHQLLRSLQWIEVRSRATGREMRQLSFRELGVEQIGHVYESLLDHTAVRAPGPVLSLGGKGASEPEVELEDIEAAREKGEDAAVAYLAEATGLTEKQVEKKLAKGPSYLSTDPQRKARWDASLGALSGRVERYAGLVREVGGAPAWWPEGSIYVTRGSDRRSAGAHYTPPSLSEPIAKHTLEPLVYQGPAEGKPQAEWKLRSARELLALRVCDLAMGSGAFLVAACRYLAERLVEAWEECEKANPAKILVSPEGKVSVGDPREAFLPADPAERLAAARRFVADRCLYGVDKDPMAVEMAKLSLWLVTLQKGKPFTFLDHALQSGDSLLGASRRGQLEAFDLSSEPKRRLDRLAEVVRQAIARASEKRRRLEGMAVDGVRVAEEKARLLAEAKAELGVARRVGDLLTAAALSTAGESESAYEGRRSGLLDDLIKAVAPDLDEATGQRRLADLERRARELLDEGKPASERPRKPFHWPLEFPEVFEHGGFDAFVGNPPFQGGQRITGTLGIDYRNHLVDRIAGGTKGSADLVAYMFLRAAELLRPEGGFGLIATNTVSQGDTREVGLDRLVGGGGTISRAVASRKWPGHANLEVALVWFRKGRWTGKVSLDGEAVEGITSRLDARGRVAGNPHRLVANQGRSFVGSYVLGMGFVLDDDEAYRLIDADPRNRDVVRPYLNGEDLNTRPDQSPSRWVIDFRDWPLTRVEEYPECLRIVREKVKPERDRNKIAFRRERWWQYASRAPNLYDTIAGMDRVLVVAATSKTLGFTFSRPVVFSHMTYVLAFDSDAIFGLMQSSLNYVWVERTASSMKKDIRYTPSDCFETFPFPEDLSGLESIGHAYYEHRASIMTTEGGGLTKTYNRFHEPGECSGQIVRLRELHVEMDHAVAVAYGWDDLDLGHDFRETGRGTRYTLSPAARREVLDRLLELNHQRQAEEVGDSIDSGNEGMRERIPGAKA